MATPQQFLPITLKKQMFSIVYALFRVASRMPNAPLAESIERGAVRLIESSAPFEPAAVEAVMGNLENLLEIGVSIAAVHPRNSELIVHEMQVFRREAQEFSRGEDIEHLGIEALFGEEKDMRQKEERVAAIKNPANFGTSYEKTRQIATRKKEDDEAAIVEGKNAAMRQSAIIERMRQSAICRLRDVQELFPEVSERTVRYDIQNLIERGLIERVGSGGPTSYYRAKNEAVTFTG